MTGTSIGRKTKVGMTVCVLLLVFLIYNGFREGPVLLGQAVSHLQRVVAVGQIVYATAALLALIGLWRRRGWAIPMLGVWCVACVIVAAAASIAWTEPRWWVAALSGVATLVVCVPIVWLARRVLRASV
jgi:hypothetical protein